MAVRFISWGATVFEAPTKLLHVLDCLDDNPHDLVCTCVSWNSTGRTIAVAYGRNDLDGWCGIPGALATWNLGREGPKEKPEAKIDCDCCLTACAFHPEKPALIAGGTFNGDLYIWDTGEDGGCQIGKSGISHVSHQDSISEISWLLSPQLGARRGRKDQMYQILTLGLDGRLLIWSWSATENPLFGFELSSGVPWGHGMALWGGSSMGLPKDGITAVVGTVAGQVFHCSLDHNETMCKRFNEAATANEAPDLHWRSPIKETEFESHAGPVCGVDCSPFQRDLFLSCGADGTIHMYSLLNGHSILSLEPASHGLSSVKWSPSRPLVFAVATDDGRVLFYDLGKSSFHPSETLDASEVSGSVSSMGFNKQFDSWFATAQGSTTKIWELGQHLTREQSVEPTLVQFISEAASAGQPGTNIFQQIQSK
ncbi:hypothetical protein BSKO_12936 [Bryopsis sp. KO-2023]|nr:hypothetical protein BSKO_12936 [Bryopsis sp. KO-2023]